MTLALNVLNRLEHFFQELVDLNTQCVQNKTCRKLFPFGLA